MKSSLPQVRVSPRFSALALQLAVLMALAAALTAAPVFAPTRAAAQQPAFVAAAPAPPATSAATETPKSAEAPKSDEDQEEAFLHSSSVQSVARILHLKVDTAVDLFLGINFAIIFFAILIPLTKLMPKIVRKRSQTLRHDFETAREATAEAQARLNAVEAKLAGLGEEIEKFRAQVEQESLEDEQRIKAALGEESARIVAAAEQEIEVAVTQARRGLRNFAADLAIDQAAKQLELSPETDRALIAEFIAGAAADASGKGGSN